MQFVYGPTIAESLDTIAARDSLVEVTVHAGFASGEDLGVGARLALRGGEGGEGVHGKVAVPVRGGRAPPGRNQPITLTTSNSMSSKSAQETTFSAVMNDLACVRGVV
jgi:hypothetical protein